MVNATLVSGYTVTDGGLLNNYAIEPQLYVEETARSGFTPFAEKLNGRYAMIGFASLLVIEVLTKHGLIWWLNNL
ncbi:high light inducible protein [Tumidithrix helvetica]|uniref:high light inducible protein n=1 Tax=Tumidithrix helvetica TaxID=3457545 RepID=UPI003CC5F192